jgi:hypothetical protein
MQTSLRLPRGLYDQLANVAGERGIGEEIRQRLEASFGQTPAGSDPKTRELALAISSLAELASRDYQPWHTDRFTFDIVEVGLCKLLALYKPKGEPTPKPNPEGLADVLYGENATPELIGAMLAAVVFDRVRGR